MTYRGHVKNGTVVLDESVALPEGAAVEVDLITTEDADDIHPEVRRFSGLLPSDLNVRADYSRRL